MKIALTLTIIFVTTGSATAQTNHTEHTNGMSHMMAVPQRIEEKDALTEPGQGAFAALSEVVRVLEGDPETDWTSVDLTNLRAHLVDMDRLVSDTLVEEIVLQNGLSAFATGDRDTLVTLRRIVPAHAAQLAQDDRWRVDVSERENGVELKVTSSVPNVAARIKGLGFFGLMASQDHHRVHHLMIARGEDAHTQ